MPLPSISRVEIVRYSEITWGQFDLRLLSLLYSWFEAIVTQRESFQNQLKSLTPRLLILSCFGQIVFHVVLCLGKSFLSYSSCLGEFSFVVFFGFWKIIFRHRLQISKTFPLPSSSCLEKMSFRRRLGVTENSFSSTSLCFGKRFFLSP